MLLLLAFACSAPEPGYPIHAVVVEVTAADEVILDHEAVPGFMDAMVMPFHVQDPSLLEDLVPGHVVNARLEIGEQGGFLTKVQVVSLGPAPPKVELPKGPLRVGQQLPATEVTFSDGTVGLIGEGQEGPIALTFLYTRCPMPDFCPATVAKLQALQELIKPPVKLVALTLDPEFDTNSVLERFAAQSSADSDLWKFGSTTALKDVALYAGMTVLERDEEIMHSKRVLLLDKDGRLLKRYDDHRFPVAEAAVLLSGR